MEDQEDGCETLRRTFRTMVTEMSERDGKEGGKDGFDLEAHWRQKDERRMADYSRPKEHAENLTARAQRLRENGLKSAERPRIQSEEELLKGLDEYTGHADELEEVSLDELMPEERLKGAVEKYERPLQPLEDWESADAMLSSHVSLLRASCQKVKALAAEHGCHNVRVFGSVARGEDTRDSDIDLLVDVEAGTTLFNMGGLQVALEEQLGVPIDLRTPGDIHRNFRADVVEEAKPIEEI